VTASGASHAITWIGHSTALLDLGGTRLLTDPVLRNRVGPLIRIAEPVSPESSRSIDGVLLSHLHADHADLPSLRRLGCEVPVLASDGATGWLRARGLRDVRGLAVGEEAEIGSLTVRATPAAHDERRWPLGPRARPIGFLVRGATSVYFAGDTDLFDELGELRGSVDVALLPVSGWGPRLPPGHLDPERAARAAAMIGPAIAIPIHWGTFVRAGLGRRPADPALPAREFASLVGRYAPGVEVRVLAPGERTITRIG
jgi:L-ascorbate metabolism protein UlaG (beta-lactamase superfamily)